MEPFLEKGDTYIYAYFWLSKYCGLDRTDIPAFLYWLKSITSHMVTQVWNTGVIWNFYPNFFLFIYFGITRFLFFLFFFKFYFIFKLYSIVLVLPNFFLISHYVPLRLFWKFSWIYPISLLVPLCLSSIPNHLNRNSSFLFHSENRSFAKIQSSLWPMFMWVVRIEGHMYI